MTQRYLEHYAEPETLLGSAVSSHYGHVLTVPVYDEGDSFFRLLSSVPDGPLGSVLVVAVVNARDDSSDGVVDRNRQLLERLGDSYPHAKAQGDSVSLHPTPFGALLSIDRSSRTRLPRKRGVGLARKIAADLALSIGARGNIASRWIHFTDADAVLPADYFAQTETVDTGAIDTGSIETGSIEAEAIEPDAAETGRVLTGARGRATRAGAAIYAFRHHSPSGELQRAGISHEMFMRYYVLGLQSARSPYAYHSIGSLIAVDATAYAEVRGVPRRHGAEDFYLLNKLAKLTRIRRLSGSAIELEARASQRVPFGTGPAIRSLIESSDAQRTFYHPACFRYLGAFLVSVERSLRSESSPPSREWLREEGSRRDLDAALIEEMADFTNLESLLQGSIARSSRPATRLRDFHTHFDALRTLQLVRWLSERGLPSSDWRSAMSSLGLAVTRDPAAVLEDLIALEQRLCSADRGLTV